jgi:hypothetical protein
MVPTPQEKRFDDQGLFIQNVQNPTSLTTIFFWNSAVARLFLSNLKGDRIEETKNKIGFNSLI